VYRQALESPILSNALKVLDGIHPKADGKDFKMYQSGEGKKMPTEHATAIMTINQLKKWQKTGEYNPETDIVLSPFNKDRFPCGTKNLNNHVAQYLGDLRKAKIHQVIAGRNTICLAEGDRVMVEKQDGTITKINLNGLYMGKPPLSNVCDINRFGKPMLGVDHASDIDGDNFSLEGYENLDVDAIPEEEKKQSASHAVHVKLDDDTECILDSVGDFSDAKFNLGYCLSVHKAQGSEWRKVFFVIHRAFKVLLFRELIYTAMTRAREELVIIDTSNALEGAIASQRIKGNSIEEKIEWFNSKLALTEVVPIIP
jgi:ATP-dependent exoDNAse (exonuclease V) alpha subunit